jgi:hypothetical protein
MKKMMLSTDIYLSITFQVLFIQENKLP